MTDTALSCTRHGTTTRLRCAECGTPICPECLVKTDVGMKCIEHASPLVAPKISPKRQVRGLVLTLVGLAAVVGGTVALLSGVGGDGGEPPEGGAPVGLPSPDRIDTPQVAVMAADGSGKRILTNRPLAFDNRPAWSPDGSRIAFESLVDGRQSIWVMEATGERLRRLTEGAGGDSAPAWSPDGTTIAFMSDRDNDPEVYLMNADGSDPRRLTDRPGMDGYPAWWPDGSRLAFVSDRNGILRVWTMAPDGSSPSLLSDVPALGDRPSVSRDGRRLLFTSDRDGNPEVYMVATDGAGLTRLTDTPAADGEAVFSPDSTRIAFASDRDGSAAVYVMAVDGTGVRKLTTGPRGFMPAWSPDGHSLLYVSDAGAPGS
ncbi:MAG: LpqB family beta-propeller domain-containing protein [Actinomycetota bacterium]|nr:LpqB family beta-propeller domain-containing protein [Actinomycetota bacterium]